MDDVKIRFDAIVIGGSGFIGEALVKELVFRGNRVASVSRHIPEQRISGVEYAAIDVGVDTEFLSALLEKGTDIFVLIGQNHANFDAAEEARIFRHLFGVIDMVENPKRVFLSSSALVYGDCGQPAAEDDSLVPIDPYSVFKRNCEEMFLKMNSKHRKVIFRLANVYGSEKNKGFIGLLLGKVGRHDDSLVHINGDGTQSRDYIFLDDVICAMLAVREKISDNDIINIATGKSYALTEVVDFISRVTGYCMVYEVTGIPLNEVKVSMIDNGKLRNRYGFVPKISLKEGIAKTWKQSFNKNDRRLKVLLIGGEGFIGRNIAEFFTKIHSCFSVGKKKSLFESRSDVFVNADPYREKMLNDYDVIVHLIDHKSVALDSFLDEERKLTENISFNDSNHLVLFSSAVVYANPDSEYGKRKRMLEDFYVGYCEERNMPLTIFRVFNTFGPFQIPYRQGSLVGNLIYNHLNGKGTDINDMDAKRDFIYVQDIPKFVDYAIKNKKLGIIDVGSGRLVSVGSLVESLEKNVFMDSVGIMDRQVREEMTPRSAGDAGMDSIELTEIEIGLLKTAKFYKDNTSIIRNYVE